MKKTDIFLLSLGLTTAKGAAMEYLNCAHAKLEDIYLAFTTGFFDYPAPLTLSRNEFWHRFFTLEGNRLETSYLAIENNIPVGLILGGIRNFRGKTTMRCAALCVTSQFRQNGIAKQLFNLHKLAALEGSCQQLTLEVLNSNHNARQFYSKLGYCELEQILYYKFTEKWPAITCSLRLCKINYTLAQNYSNTLYDINLLWQNDFPSMQPDENLHYFAAYSGKHLAAVLVISNNGVIKFLHVGEFHRRRSVASALIYYAIDKISPKQLSLPFVHCHCLHMFARVMGFYEENTAQQQLFLPLS